MPSAKAEILMQPITDSNIQPVTDSNSIEMNAVLKQADSVPQTVSSIPVSNNEQTISVYIYNTEKTVTLTIDDYLTGVVAAEMPALFETEALKAQAVAARTYLMHRLQYGKCGRGGADICTDCKHCQAWLSVAQQQKSWGVHFDTYSKKIHDAVYSTTGQVIYYNNQPIDALYHSVSGGKTEDCAAVFSEAEPYLVSVSSPGEEGDSNYKSQNIFTPTQLVSLINNAFPKAKLSAKNISSQIKILSHDESGRVDKVKVGSDTIKATDLRLAIGLKSTNFSISYKNDNIIFDVIGYGHGVGMSQRGADVMAQQGNKYIEILEHYYPGTNVK